MTLLSIAVIVLFLGLIYLGDKVSKLERQIEELTEEMEERLPSKSGKTVNDIAREILG